MVCDNVSPNCRDERTGRRVCEGQAPQPRKAGTAITESAPDSVKSEHLLLLAQGIAEQMSTFFEKKGPGAGDHATAGFVRALNKLAREVFGVDYSEKLVHKAAGFGFDYFFPEENTAVEFAFGLHNPNSELNATF